jgi:predicted nucleic acid-binding protein
MEWVNRLRGTTVGLDTAPLIYFIERHPKYLPIVYPFFEAVQRGDIQVVTSTLTVTEVLVLPYKRGNFDLVDRYSHMLLNTRNLETLSVTPQIAGEAAKLRAANKIQTPDSIQLATALHAGATAFVSNDSEIPSVTGIELILLDNLLMQP